MQKIHTQAPDGSIVSANEMEFEEITAPWTKVKCEDGTTLMIKMNVTAVIRLDIHDPITGSPIYHIQTQNLVRATDIPPKLRKLPNAPPEKTDQEIS